MKDIALGVALGLAGMTTTALVVPCRNCEAPLVRKIVQMPAERIEAFANLPPPHKDGGP